MAYTGCAVSADTRRLREAFARTFGVEAEFVAEAPGRVNLIGEHTDYNQGFALPVAIGRTIAVAASANPTDEVRVVSLDFGECDEFSQRRVERAPEHSWRNYVRGVAWALGEAGYDIGGVSLAILGDVPVGAGLSSSAALAVAVAGAMCGAAGVAIDGRESALICQRAESEFVGVQCGIMDQFAACLSQEGHALYIDCRSNETRQIPLPSEVAIVVVDSKVRRELTTIDYNLRRKECAEAAKLLGVMSLRDVDADLISEHGQELTEHVLRRARHVVTENDRVLATVAALRSRDMATVGGLLLDSHASLRDDFETSTRELDLLVELASRLDGVLGARMTGAGFGGCTVNLVRPESIEEFRKAVLKPYQQITALAAELHVCSSVGGLRVAHV